jgi:hypothetical protein
MESGIKNGQHAREVFNDPYGVDNLSLYSARFQQVPG